MHLDRLSEEERNPLRYSTEKQMAPEMVFLNATQAFDKFIPPKIWPKNPFSWVFYVYYKDLSTRGMLSTVGYMQNWYYWIRDLVPNKPKMGLNKKACEALYTQYYRSIAAKDKDSLRAFVSESIFRKHQTSKECKNDLGDRAPEMQCC